MTQIQTISNLLTFGDLQAALPDMRGHQILYLLKSRKIQPLGRLGASRIFGVDAIDKLRVAHDSMTKGREPA